MWPVGISDFLILFEKVVKSKHDKYAGGQAVFGPFAKRSNDFMIQKTTFGTPLDTNAVALPVEEGELRHFMVKKTENGLFFQCPLDKEAVIYGLG